MKDAIKLVLAILVGIPAFLYMTYLNFRLGVYELTHLFSYENAIKLMLIFGLVLFGCLYGHLKQRHDKWVYKKIQEAKAKAS